MSGGGFTGVQLTNTAVGPAGCGADRGSQRYVSRRPAYGPSDGLPLARQVHCFHVLFLSHAGSPSSCVRPFVSASRDIAPAYVRGSEKPLRDATVSAVAVTADARVLAVAADRCV